MGLRGKFMLLCSFSVQQVNGVSVTHGHAYTGARFVPDAIESTWSGLFLE